MLLSLLMSMIVKCSLCGRSVKEVGRLFKRNLFGRQRVWVCKECRERYKAMLRTNNNWMLVSIKQKGVMIR